MLHRRPKGLSSRIARPLLAGALWLALWSVPAGAVDPPYQAQLERLAAVMGSLYFLQPLCGNTEIDWRHEAGDLIEYELPDPDRRARLEGAFNEGFEGFARLYSHCTSSALTAIERFLAEGDRIARDIHSRYAD